MYYTLLIQQGTKSPRDQFNSHRKSIWQNTKGGGDTKGAPGRRNHLNKFAKEKVFFGGGMGVKKILFERRWRGGQSVDSPECEFKRSRGSREGFGQSFHRMKVASRKIIWTKLSSDEFTYANETPRYRVTITQFSGG